MDGLTANVIVFLCVSNVGHPTQSATVTTCPVFHKELIKLSMAANRDMASVAWCSLCGCCRSWFRYGFAAAVIAAAAAAALVGVVVFVVVAVVVVVYYVGRTEQKIFRTNTLPGPKRPSFRET